MRDAADRLCELDVARPDTEVRIDKIEVRDFVLPDPRELAFDAFERELVDATLRRLPPVAERAGKRATAIGFEHDCGDGCDLVTRAKLVERAVEIRRSDRVERRQPSTWQTGDCRRPTRDDTCDAGERFPAPLDDLEKRELALAEHECVEERMRVEKCHGIATGHRRTAGNDDELGAQGLRVACRFECVARVPRVER